MPKAMTRVHSYYRDNIPPVIVDMQARVFDHFDIPLTQHLDNSTSHAAWLDAMLSQSGDETVVFADIDAFPLSRGSYDRLVELADAGALTGLAQVAEHKDPTRIYAGPMFMAVGASMWRELGRPSMARNSTCDVAQSLTEAAAAAGRDVVLIYPKFAIQPKWALADRGVFGIGTFYGELEFFHLFQSRMLSSVTLFEAVARDTIAGKLDFAAYLSIMSEERPRQRFRWPWFR